MNSSINPSTTLASTSSTDAAMVPFNRAICFSTYIPHQKWSIPDSIIYYISKNATSAKVYGKLIQSCKYFLIRNRPIIVNEVELEQIDNELNIDFDGKLVDLNALPSKIWISSELIAFSSSKPAVHNFLSILSPKICQSSIKEIFLFQQICLINDLKFLGSKCEKIEFIDTLVLNRDGSVTAFEQFLQAFPLVANIRFDFDVQNSQMVTPTTATELIKLPHFSNLQYFNLFYIPETFDIDVFYAYMKKNRKTKFDLHFCNQISNEYRNRLLTVVTEIIAADSHDYKVPFIYFNNLDDSVLTSLKNIYCKS